MPRDQPPTPTRDSILRMAKASLARRASSRQELQVRLLRKLARRRGDVVEDADDAPDLAALVAEVVDRLARAGLLDDAGLAVSRAIGFTTQGLPAGRIRDTLKRQGLEATHADVDDRIEHDDDAQARRFAERKRLGPFGSGRRAPSRERDVRAMVRAGFSPRLAMRVLDDLEAAEAAEAEARYDSAPTDG